MTEADITNALARAKCCLADMQYKLTQKRAQGSKDADCLERKTFLLSMYIEALDNVLDCVNGDPSNATGEPCNLDLLSGGYCWDAIGNNVYIMIASGDDTLIPYEEYYYEYALSTSPTGPWTENPGFNTNYAVIGVEGLENYLRIRMYCNQNDSVFREEIVQFKVYPPEFDAATFGYFTTTTDTSPTIIPASWSVRAGETVTITNRNASFIISNIEVDNVSVVTDVQTYTFTAGTDITDGQSIEIFFQYIGDSTPPPCDLYRLVQITVVPDPVIVASNTVMCPGGSVELSVSNYAYTTFLWSTGETTDTITVTEPGVYSVLTSYGTVTGLIDYQTITDDGINPQFIIYSNATSTELDTLSYNCAATSAIADIEISELTGINTTGATVAYYNSGGNIVSGLAYPGTGDLSGNGDGLYAVITLSTGCTYQTPVYTEYILGAVTVATITNCTCNGLADGVVEAAPSTFTYGTVTLVDIDFELYNASAVLVNSSTGLSYSYSGLAAGNYTLQWIENWSNGFSCAFGPMSVNITQPSPLIINGTHVPLLCYDGATSGSIDITISGGTGPYDVYFDTIEVLSNVTSPVSYAINSVIPDDTYSLSVVDANGCTYNHTVTVTNPTELVVNASTRAATVDLNSISGGTVPYVSAELYDPTFTLVGTFSLSLPNSLTGLTPGDYYVVVTDTNACIASIGPLTVT